MSRSAYRNSKRSQRQTRTDSLSHRSTGMGSAKDKLTGLNPSYRQMESTSSRQWYMTNGFIQNIIDAPAEDATREWITVRTNMDNDDLALGVKGLGISRLIETRLEELGLRQKMKDLIRYSRMYQNGGFLLWGITANAPQTDIVLRDPLPSEIIKLDYINVFGPDRVSLMFQQDDPLSRDYHRPRFYVSGTPVDPSRLSWMVHSYIPEERRGVSVIDTILDGIKAQDVALWSVTSLLFEMCVKVFKSPRTSTTDPQQLVGFLSDMMSVMSTQESVAIDADEELSRLDSNSSSNGQIKQLFDFIFDNLAGLSRIPKSRLMGNSQGVITAGQFDIVSYYDTIAKFQELEVRPIIEKCIKLIVHETSGDISKRLGANIKNLDWQFEFAPLWKVGPVEQADIDLKLAQKDQIYITTGVLNPSEVKSQRFADLEQHSTWEKAPVNLSKPAIKLLLGGKDGTGQASKQTSTDLEQKQENESNSNSA